MQELMKADIFFFITSIAVILVTVGVIVILYYVVKILRNVTSISDRIEEGSRALEADFQSIRTKMKSGEIALKLTQSVFEKASKWLSKSSPKKKTRVTSKTEEETKEAP